MTFSGASAASSDSGCNCKKQQWTGGNEQKQESDTRV